MKLGVPALLIPSCQWISRLHPPPPPPPSYFSRSRNPPLFCTPANSSLSPLTTMVQLRGGGGGVTPITFVICFDVALGASSQQIAPCVRLPYAYVTHDFWWAQENETIPPCRMPGGGSLSPDVVTLPLSPPPSPLYRREVVSKG